MNDEHLVASFQAGDKSAFLELYRQYAGIVFRFVYQRLSDRHDAEDMTQEIFMDVCDALPATELRKDFRSWLFGIAANKIKAYWTRAYAMPVSSVEELLDSEEVALASQRLYAEDSEAKDAPLVQKLMAMLPENQAQVILLRFYHGYSRKEVAKELKTSENNVKIWQYRGLRTLQENGLRLLEERS